MAYKKYIKRGGKFYGPYTYHSRRVNGKVVSEYRGRGNKVSVDYKRFFFIFLGVFLLLIAVYFSFNFMGGLSGKIIFNVETIYHENDSLEGAMQFSLKQGELLPASSKIIVESDSGQIYEYNLNELVSNEVVDGYFYIEGKSVSGEGEGYGVKGEKRIYPSVDFTLEVISETTSVEEEEVPEEEPEETPTEEPVPEETPEEEVIEEEVEEVTVEEPIEEEMIPEETPIEEVIPTEEPEEIIPEETPIEEVIPESAPEEPEEAPVEEQAPPEEPESTPEAPTEEKTITGGIIRALGGIFNIFRGLTPTGQISLEIVSEISGAVSKENPFTYELSKGETASLKSGSVSADSKELSDSVVELTTEGNEVLVTTEYYETEEGFGEDYLGDVDETIIIDLSELNILSEKGNLKISLVYDEEEIVSATTVLEKEGEVVTATKETTITEEQIEVEQNITSNETAILNVTANVTVVENVLTDKEKEILVEEFGNVSVKRTAELINDRIVIRYELGDYWIKYSYDYNSLDEINDEEIEGERIKWLRELVNTLSKEKTSSEQIANFTESYPIE